MMYGKLVFSFIVLIHVSCHMNRQLAQKRQSALVQVEAVQQFSGCNIILRTKEGQQFIPLQIDENSCVFQPEDVFKINFEYLTEPVYGCTLHSVLPIRILGCSLIKAGLPDGTGGIKPEKQLCTWTTDAYGIPWMAQVIGQLDPDRITRYRYYDGGAYYFESLKGYYLFDCKGIQICYDPEDATKCVTNTELRDRFVILVRNY